MRRRYRWAMTAAVCLGLAFAPQPASAQWWTANYLKNSSRIHKLFKDVVKESRGWTVQVKADDQDAALGVIVDAAGYVLTKASQLGGSITCSLQDGRRLPGEIVGIDRKYDLALVKVDAHDLPSVTWNVEQTPEVGRWVVTPGTEDVPLAVGVVSVMPREIPNEPAFLGVQFAEGVPGPKIVEVLPGGAAARSGLKAGDIVMRVAGEKIPTGESLKERVAQFAPGDACIVRVQRSNQVLDVLTVMGSLEGDFGSNGRPLLFNVGTRLSQRRSGFPQAFQHDTVLEPEQCGGCVLGLDGRAVGINIARADRTMTHAIPAREVLTLVEELKSGKLAPERTAKGGLVSVRVPAPPLPEVLSK